MTPMSTCHFIPSTISFDHGTTDNLMVEEISNVDLKRTADSELATKDTKCD